MDLQGGHHKIGSTTFAMVTVNKTSLCYDRPAINSGSLIDQIGKLRLVAGFSRTLCIGR